MMQEDHNIPDLSVEVVTKETHVPLEDRSIEKTVTKNIARVLL